ncbi:MAG: hypothetical protein IKL08_07155 [Clostridia bacterium]|nr:hypothetical protein [Clostridia bacterium]
MKKVLGSIVFVLYVTIVLTVTILLLSYNEYMCSEINGYTVYIVRDDMLEPHYVKGDLLLIKHVSDKNVNIGDKLYFYQNVSNNDYFVRYGEVTDKIEMSRRTVYTIDGQYQYDSSYLIGEEDGSYVFHKIGGILAVLESRWGYLFFVVIITLLLFLEELYELYMEIKYGNEITTVKEG